MVHTMIIIKEIFYSEYTSIEKRLSKFTFEDGEYRTLELNPLGINKVALSKSSSDSHVKFYLKITINLAVLVNSNNYIGVAGYDELIKYDYVSLINDILKKDIGINYLLSDFNLYEIHYAYDYIPQYNVELMLLLHKSKCLDKRYFKKINLPKNESYYFKSESVIINFYNKIYDINNKKLKGKNITPQMLSYANNILRFEVQCKRGKVKRLLNKYGSDCRNPEYFINPDIAFEVVEEYLSTILCQNDFMSFTKACSRIKKNKTLSNKKKDNLMFTLHIIRKSKNIDEARERYIKKTFSFTYCNKRIVFGGSINTFKAYIEQIEKLGINPVTIPNERGVRRIKNPLYSIDKNK